MNPLKRTSTMVDHSVEKYIDDMEGDMRTAFSKPRFYVVSSASTALGLALSCWLVARQNSHLDTASLVVTLTIGLWTSMLVAGAAAGYCLSRRHSWRPALTVLALGANGLYVTVAVAFWNLIGNGPRFSVGGLIPGFAPGLLLAPSIMFAWAVMLNRTGETTILSHTPFC
jgi:hypothetical protein